MPVGEASLLQQHLASELEHGREDERAERDERRGLEARASALLAAGAAVVGLVANAFRDFNVHGAERDAFLAVIVLASAVMVVALALAAMALSVGMTEGGHGPDQIWRLHTIEDVVREFVYVEKIRRNNKRMLRRLRPAARFFAGSVTVFLFILIWAAFASAPPVNTHVVVKNTKIVNKSPRQTTPAPTSECATYVLRLDELVDDNPQLVGFLYRHAFPIDAGARRCGLESPRHARAIIRELALR